MCRSGAWEPLGFASSYATGYQSDIVITREVPRNESSREYNTTPREIVSYNNDDAQNAPLSLSHSLSHPRIRNYSAYPNADRWNPLSIANRILPARCPRSPLSPFSRIAVPTEFSHSREMESISTRETELTHIPYMNFAHAGKFSRANIFETIVQPPFRTLPFPSYLCRAFCTKHYVINLQISHALFRASVNENSIMDDRLLISDFLSVEKE